VVLVVEVGLRAVLEVLAAGLELRAQLTDALALLGQQPVELLLHLALELGRSRQRASWSTQVMIDAAK
jgi:hypothetical protein